MLKRQLSYLLLAGFATVMVILLMLDDPATRQTQMLNFGATQQAARPVQLFPAITDPAEIMGIEVVNLASGTGQLVMRDEQGRWYAPELPDIQESIAAEELSQAAVESAAIAITLLGAEQTFEATPDNMVLFGLSPTPVFRFRFQGQDASGRTYEATVDVGNANPDNMAYYVYVEAVPDTEQCIYLIPKELLDFILDMDTETNLITPTLAVESVESEDVTPVP
jgi:hypothetical protein